MLFFSSYLSLSLELSGFIILSYSHDSTSHHILVVVSTLEVAILFSCPNSHANHHHPGLLPWPKSSGFHGWGGM